MNCFQAVSKASDLAGKPIVATIDSAETEELKDMNGKPATKLVLGFKMRKVGLQPTNRSVSGFAAKTPINTEAQVR
jgi:hypothetical protein